MDASIQILLVEDHAPVAAVMAEMLGEGGFTVMVAEDGTTAFDMLDERAGTLAALVSDIRLPDGPNGWDVAQRARTLRPDLPVVYMSGDSAHAWAANGVPNSVMLQKPFAPVQLVTAVASLINRAAGGMA